MDVHLCDSVEYLSKSVSASGDSGVMGYILLLLVLIGLNAFFASSELAIVSLNDAKLEKMAQEGHKKAKIIYAMTQKPTKFLSTIQIGVTLSGFLSSAVAADTFADYIVFWFRNSGIAESTVRLCSIFVITILLTFVTLIFGELLPKRIAMNNPEKVAFAVCGPVNFCYKLFKPLVWLVSKAVDGLGHLIGIKEGTGEQEYSEEEIRIMVDAGNEKGFIENNEKEMINKVFEFNDLTVGEVMTHRTEMVHLDITDNIETIIETFKESGYSRIPVCGESVDDIKGFLYIKDLLPFLYSDNEQFNINDYLREAKFVYENMKCDDVLLFLKKEKIQMAIVCDEYGGTFGLVTMEDLIESIVGEIQDEYDEEEKEIDEVGENHYVVEGSALIDEVSEMIGVDLGDGESDTISGLIMDHINHVPLEGEKVEITIGEATLKVLEINDQTIERVDIVVNRKEETEELEK